MTAQASAGRQQGQVLVLGMLLIGVAAAAFLRYFSVGQVVAARARQVHALDAAAYSGALVQARALNMLAYLNTAQIGHQIAMAHLVTLGSWSAFGGTQARQAGVGNPPAYLIAMLFGADHGAAFSAARRASAMGGLADAGGELARAYAAHDDFVTRVFGHVQQAVAESVPRARYNTIQAVLAGNYPGHPGGNGRNRAFATGKTEPASSVSPALSAAPVSAQATGSTNGAGHAGFDVSISHDNWPGFLKAYSGRRGLRSIVQQVAALYHFLGPRNHTVRSHWVVDAQCPSLRHELRRRGATEMDASGRWQSLDTQSFHALRANRWIGCYRREYPMGWGWVSSAPGQKPDSPYVDDPPDNFASQDFWRWVKQATDWDTVSNDSNPLADSKAVAGRRRWRGSGLADYLDVNDQSRGKVLHFDVELRHPGPDGLTITTRSAAEVFFARPEPRADEMLEHENLFHPYWQARLAAPRADTEALS